MYRKFMLCLVFAVSFINTNLYPQTINDTIHFDVIRQFSVKYYIITDTINGATYKIKYGTSSDSLSYHFYDSTNCVLKIEAIRKCFKKNLIVYIRPKSSTGKFLWLKVINNRINYAYRPKRWGIL